jgi:hypothetical protein
VAVARIVGAALSNGNRAPVVARIEIAEKLGADVATVSRALKVFNLPGSPIERKSSTVRSRRADGSMGPKTSLEFHCRDVANATEIIEQMVKIGRDRVRPRTLESLRRSGGSSVGALSCGRYFSDAFCTHGIRRSHRHCGLSKRDPVHHATLMA